MAKATGSFCFNDDEIKDVEEQSQAAKALKTYVEEVVAAFETLVVAHEKLRDGAMKELWDVEQSMETPLNNFGSVVRHMREIASQTTVGLQVHQRKLTACHEALARTDEAAAMLRSMGVTLETEKVIGDSYSKSKVSATTSKEGRRRQKTQKDEERLAKLIHAAQVQQAYARSTLEACVTRRERLVELAQKSLAAVARTIPQVDEIIAVDVFQTLFSSKSTVTSDSFDSNYNGPWNSPRLDLITKGNDAMLFQRLISDSSLDRIVRSGKLHQDPGTSCTNPCTTSGPPRERCANNPFNMDPTEVVHTTNRLFEPWSKDRCSEESTNNPFNEDCAKLGDAERSEHMPFEGPVRLASSPATCGRPLGRAS